MAIQSIQAAVQIGDIRGQHLFVAAEKMPLGNVNGVSELDDLAKKIRPHAEALNNFGEPSAVPHRRAIVLMGIPAWLAVRAH